MPRAQLLAEGPVPGQRRAARGHQVAEPGQPGERGQRGPERHAQPGGLGQPAGDQRGAGVVAEAQPLGDAAGQRDHVLRPRRRARSPPCRGWCRAGSTACGRPPAAPRRASVSVHAMTVAAGCSSAISRARFGPDSTAIRSGPAPVTSEMTSLIRLVVPSSMPFISESRVDVRRAAAAPSARGCPAATATARRGRRVRRRPAPRPASPVAGTADGQPDAGQVVAVLARLGDRRRPAPAGGRAG